MAGFGVDRGSGSSSGSTDTKVSVSLVDAKGDLIVGTANDAVDRLAVGTDNQRLVADSTQVKGLKWVGDTQNTVATAKGDLIAGTAASTVARVAVGADNTRLVADSAQTTGVKWVADTQNSVVTTKGDILAATAASTITRVAVGSDDQGLIADSAQTAGVRWGTVPAATTRQTQLSGKVDSTGYNNTLSAGAALNFNVAATATPAVFTFANGFGSGGSVDTYTQLTADASNQGSLNANNTHFIHATRSSSSAVTWGQCLVPPDYGYAFDRTRGALLNFEGTNGSSTFVDDFGNTWTATSATITTAQSKFGTASMDLTGASKYITSTNFTTLGDGSWEMSCWFRINALPGVGTNATFFSARNAGASCGVDVALNNTAGTTKLQLNAGSNGSSFDIANATLGTNTTWTLNQWNRVRLVFDALAGTYRVYLSLNGAAETQDISVSSSSRICAVTAMRVGEVANSTGAPFNGWIDAFRFIRAATVTTTETPGVTAPAITDYPYHWFSIPEMKMYEVTSASASAGVNPGMTQRNRVFVGEADTGAATVSAVRNYALRGEYDSGLTATFLGTSTSVSKNHNLGLRPELVRLYAVNLTTQSGYSPGERVLLGNTAGASQVVQHTLRTTRTAVSFATQSASGLNILPASGGDTTNMTAANWGYQIRCSRGW